MIDRHLAQQLKQAGLDWHPAERDAFIIPSPTLDDEIFVVSQLTALPQQFKGEPSITFHGSVEWALDYVLQADAIWMPSEAQVRDALEQHLPNHGADMLRLERTQAGYRCVLGHAQQQQVFDANNAASAYSLALLHVLQHGFSSEPISSGDSPAASGY